MYYGPIRLTANIYAGAVRTAQLLMPWVDSLDDAGNHEVALLTQPVGTAEAGVYAKIDGRWLRLLDYQDVLQYISAGVVNFDLPVADVEHYVAPTGATLYFNGIPQPAGTIPNNMPGWSSAPPPPQAVCGAPGNLLQAGPYGGARLEAGVVKTIAQEQDTALVFNFDQLVQSTLNV